MTLTSETAFVVKEHAEEILERIVQFKKRVFQALVAPGHDTEGIFQQSLKAGDFGSCINYRNHLRDGYSRRPGSFGGAVTDSHISLPLQLGVIDGESYMGLSYLTNQFPFEPSRLSVAGYGEYPPVSSNATAESRALNRRADLVILSEAAEKQEPN